MRRGALSIKASDHISVVSIGICDLVAVVLFFTYG
jgi:hypothetical protein